MSLAKCIIQATNTVLGIGVWILSNVLCSLLWIVRLTTEKSQVSTNPPCFKGLPFIGNALQIIKTSWPVDGMPPQTYTLQAICGLAMVYKKEKLFQITLGNLNFILLFKPEYVEKLLSSNVLLDKGKTYEYFYPWLREGLITSPKSKWKKRRKMLTPTFHFKILDDFQPTIYKKSQILIDIMRSKKDEEFIDVDHLVSLFTMDVICETAIGKSVDAQLKSDTPYVQSLKKLSQLSFRRASSPWLWPEMLFRLAPSGREFYKSLNVVNATTEQVIRERKETLRHNSELLNSEEKVRHAFLDLLVMQHLRDSEAMDELGIIEEVNTFMFAGQDTTSVGITWCLFLIGHHPEVQQKLYSEIQGVFGDDKDMEITLEKLKELSYLDCVLKESQRLYPSVPLFSRQITEDLDLGDYIARKGKVCVVLSAAMHRDESFFPDPLSFQPDRFLKENCEGRSPFAFVPFSAGPRNCIGQRFALNEEKTAVVNIMRNFQITSLDQKDKIAVCPELVSRPSKTIRMKFVERQ